MKAIRALAAWQNKQLKMNLAPVIDELSSGIYLQEDWLKHIELKKKFINNL